MTRHGLFATSATAVAVPAPTKPLAVALSRVGPRSGWREAAPFVSAQNAARRRAGLKIARAQQTHKRQDDAISSFVAQRGVEMFLAPVAAEVAGQPQA